MSYLAQAGAPAAWLPALSPTDLRAGSTASASSPGISAKASVTRLEWVDAQPWARLAARVSLQLPAGWRPGALSRTKEARDGVYAIEVPISFAAANEVRLPLAARSGGGATLRVEARLNPQQGGGVLSPRCEDEGVQFERVAGQKSSELIALDCRREGKTLTIAARLLAPGSWNEPQPSSGARLAEAGHVILWAGTTGGPGGELFRAKTSGGTYSASLAPPKRHFFSLGLGLSGLSYQQTGKPWFSEMGLTVKAAYDWEFMPRKFDIGFSGYFTALPFLESRAVDTRYLGLNLRAGWALPFIHDPWRVDLKLGAYYTTMFVAANAFGYQNVGGPQFYPTASLKLGARDSLSGYFKFSPVTDGITLLAISNHEFAGGLAYTHRFRFGLPLTVSFDAAELHLETSGVVIDSTSLTLGLGVGF